MDRVRHVKKNQEEHQDVPAHSHLQKGEPRVMTHAWAVWEGECLENKVGRRTVKKAL